MSIGVNLRVTGYSHQGGRKYMEDCFSVAYQQTDDDKDLEYTFIGIYDGHGGAEAAQFAKEHLMESIIKHKNFWSDNDEEVLRSIKDGYIATHYAMWKEQAKWPRTASGLPSTAGTTASVAFIRRGKIYVGHVGDSGIVLGYQPPDGSSEWKAKPLTRDHKPENPEEMRRIHQCGGKVALKSGVPRVVWNRPRIGHQGPVRRSTLIDEIPFLAVARSLGDLWSYNSRIDQFVVSPNPDCSVLAIDTSIHRCLVFGTDGLFNMLSPTMVVAMVHDTERRNEYATLNEVQKGWLNPSKLLVERALERWQSTHMRADNTSVVTLILDPPGPPRSQILKESRKTSYPTSGLKIVTRFNDPTDKVPEEPPKLQPEEHPITKEEATPNSSTKDVPPISSSEIDSPSYPLKERNFAVAKTTSSDVRDSENGKENKIDEPTTDDTIQINEISSSSTDVFEKHNLRSYGAKRKTAISAEEPIRKSSRLDKLKKTDGNPTSTKKTFDRKSILRRKKMKLRKRIIKKTAIKKKLKLMLDSIKQNINNASLVKVISKTSIPRKKTKGVLMGRTRSLNSLHEEKIEKKESRSRSSSCREKEKRTRNVENDENEGPYKSKSKKPQKTLTPTSRRRSSRNNQLPKSPKKVSVHK